MVLYYIIPLGVAVISGDVVVDESVPFGVVVSLCDLVVDEELPFGVVVSSGDLVVDEELPFGAVTCGREVFADVVLVIVSKLDDLGNANTPMRTIANNTIIQIAKHNNIFHVFWENQLLEF